MTRTAPPIPAPRALLVDLFHTLVVLRPGGDLGRPTWEVLGLDRDVWRERFFADDEGRLLGRITNPVEAIRVLAHDLDPSIPMERIARAAAERGRRLEDGLTNVDAGTLTALASLRDMGIPAVLVSNAGADEILAWPRSPLAPLLTAAVFSCEVGVAKPDRGIYDEALHVAGVPPECAGEVLFAGDGGSDELRGARAAGLRTVLVNGHAARLWPERLDAARPFADHEVADIPELIRRLAR